MSRLNCYAEEITGRVELVSKRTQSGDFVGIRIFLKSPEDLTAPNALDDSDSAVTFWFFSEEHRREWCARIGGLA
jgi:hypothetical protein